MNSKNIYIIRHGETEFNKKGLVQGSSINSNLNKNGFAQADSFFKHYEHVPFDKIYVSKLKRTLQSVQNYVLKGVPYQTLWGLNEISWGEKEGRPLTQDDNDKHFHMLREWRGGNYHFKLDGGESPAEVWSRQKTAFQYILSNPHEENILVSTHGRALRILLAGLLNMPLREMDQFKHQNLCLYKLHYSFGQFKIVMENDISHLDTVQSPFVNQF